MEMADYIKVCRYYKGEKEAPFKDTDEKTFWSIEKMWVEKSVIMDDVLKESLYDYFAYGLREFEKQDDTPLSLKAFLANRLFQYAERVDIEEFKHTYKTRYIRNK